MQETKLKDQILEVKPFLKWAGGKKQVLGCIDYHLPNEIKDSKTIENYFEPFIGGGAVFFHLISNYNIKHAYLGDINKDLILTYNVVKKNPKELISYLKDYSAEFIPKSKDERKDFYYHIRYQYNKNLENFSYEDYSEDHILRASHLIFLNKTCFNGLYRVNQKGKFNVPIGRYKNPLICDETNLLNVSKILKDVDINCSDYSNSEKLIDDNSFVYLDPPYLPIKENSFTTYNSESFGLKEQVELSEFCKRIDKKNAKFILSNSDPKNEDIKNNFFEDHYNEKHFVIKRIDVRRAINSDANKRGLIKELLIYNY